jgi:hypothetical protein
VGCEIRDHASSDDVVEIGDTGLEKLGLVLNVVRV